MGVPLSLCHSTVPELTPAQAIEVAEATGCRHVSVRLMSDPPGGAVFPILRDAGMLRETVRRARGTGVSVLDVEVARLQPDTDVAAFGPFLNAAAELGASHVLVTGDDPDELRLSATYAAFCDIAAEFGLSAELEFVPWLTVRDLAVAERIVRRANRPNSGILVDTLHLDRSGGGTRDLLDVPKRWLHYEQISDAATEQPRDVAAMIHTAREERSFPGDGGLDLASMMRAMPAGITVALEIPTATLARTMPALERVTRAVAATRRVLASAGWK